MTRDVKTPAYSAALAVAMSARTDGLTQHAVDDMRTRAEELLARDDPMRAAMLNFATQYEHWRHDKAAMRMFGEALGRDLDQSLGLMGPERRERRDIDG